MLNIFLLLSGFLLQIHKEGSKTQRCVICSNRSYLVKLPTHFVYLDIFKTIFLWGRGAPLPPIFVMDHLSQEHAKNLKSFCNSPATSVEHSLPLSHQESTHPPESLHPRYCLVTRTPNIFPPDNLNSQC